MSFPAGIVYAAIILYDKPGKRTFKSLICETRIMVEEQLYIYAGETAPIYHKPMKIERCYRALHV